MSPSLADRRSFLKAIAGGSGFLAWPKAIFARAAEQPNYSFVVVSDTHLGREDKTDAADLWQKSAKEIDVLPSDFVLHLGDIVDGGREKQYGVYKDIRKTIRKPIYEIPGNHDPEELFKKHIRQPVDTSFDHKGVRFVLMNNSRFKVSDGFLRKPQLEWLAQQLSEAAKQNLYLIIAMHVPVHTNDKPDPGAFVRPADGQTELYRLLKAHRTCALALLHGHFHCGLRGWDDHAPLHEIIFPSGLFNVDYRLTEQKAPGYNLPEFQPGYTIVKLDEHGLTLKYKPINENEGPDKVCPLTQFKP